MAYHTVREVAAIAGVSVRTLHHYHEIGLLDPAHVGANGYRYYGREELLRLQQILIHRELGILLSDIGRILDAPDFDRLVALKNQRERIAEEAARSAEMLKTIDRTIAELEGERVMQDAELYSGIVDPKKQKEYEAWLVDKYGPEMEDHIESSNRQMAKLTKSEREARMAELADIEQSLAAAFGDGVLPEAHSLDPLVKRHFEWVKASWGKEASISSYAGLADIYLSHPDFVARYEHIRAGFAEFLAAAMRNWARRQ